jgi:hypothetical protein
MPRKRADAAGTRESTSIRPCLSFLRGRDGGVNLSRAPSPSSAAGSAGPASVERRASAGREASSSRALSATAATSRRPRGARASEERGSVSFRETTLDSSRSARTFGPRQRRKARSGSPCVRLVAASTRESVSDERSTSRQLLEERERTRARCGDTPGAAKARASEPLEQHEEPRLRSGSAHDLRHCRRSPQPLLSPRQLGNQLRVAGAKPRRTEGALAEVVRPRHGGRVATFARSRRLPFRMAATPRGHAPARE